MSKLITNKLNFKMGETNKDVAIVNGFLKRFGYVTKEIAAVANLTGAEPEVFDVSTALALKRYQRANKLVESGKYDVATATVMSQPRCGFPDVADFVVDGRKWTHTNITYTIENTPANLSIGQIRNSIAQALSIWTAVTPLEFSEIPQQQNADFRIKFVEGDHSDGVPFDGPGFVLAHAFFPPPNSGELAGDAHFDTAETWNVVIPTPTSEFDIITVAAHEFGHSLGLAHSQVQGALMFPTYNGPHRFLAADDVTGIQSIYGKK